jgi:hypothetical protein
MDCCHLGRADQARLAAYLSAPQACQAMGFCFIGDNKPGSTNRRRRFGRPQGEPSVSEAKGP